MGWTNTWLPLIVPGFCGGGADMRRDNSPALPPYLPVNGANARLLPFKRIYAVRYLDISQPGDLASDLFWGELLVDGGEEQERGS